MPAPVNTSEEYAIYLRKSRVDIEAEARGEGDTLARHRRTLLDFARRLGISITHIYEEVVSGETIDARPQMKRLLQDVEAGRWKGVLCMEVERLARGNTSDQGLVSDTFKYSGTQIITPMKTYTPDDEFDEEFFEFGLFRSRMEYKTITRRLQRGRMASLNEGKYIAGRPPYGFEKYKLPKEKGFSLRPCAPQAQVVQDIFSLFVHGELQPDGSMRPLGSHLIAKRLNATGVPSPSGGKWVACSVRELLRNPAYAGKVRWQYRPVVKSMVNGKRVTSTYINDEALIFDGLHPAIVSYETWQIAQQRLKERSNAPVPKNKEIKNPLAGLVYCSFCGHSMVRQKYQHGADALSCPQIGCPCKGSTLDEVEQALLSALRLWLSDYKVKVSSRSSSSDSQPSDPDRQVTQLHQALAALEKQMNNLYTLVEQGVYTPDLFLQRSKVLSAQISETKRELALAKKRLALDRALQRSRVEIIPHIEHVLAVYPTLTDPKEKNALLKQVIEKAVYTKTKGGRWEPSDLSLHLFPRLSPSLSSLSP